MITFLQLQNKPPKRCFFTLKNHLLLRSLIITNTMDSSINVISTTCDIIGNMLVHAGIILMQTEKTAIVRIRLPDSGMYNLLLLARSGRPVSTSAPSSEVPKLRYEAVCRLQLVARDLAPVIGAIGAHPELQPFHRDPVFHCSNGKDYFHRPSILTSQYRVPFNSYVH